MPQQLEDGTIVQDAPRAPNQDEIRQAALQIIQTKGIDPFREALARLNPRFEDVANQLQGIAGGNDPRFAAYRDQLQSDASSQISQFFGRRGTGGGTAALNAGLRERNRIGSQVGMQQLQRQDQALTGQLDPLTAFLENLTVEPQLQLQALSTQTAADNASNAGRKSCLLLCLILTEELARTGELHPDLFRANIVWAIQNTTNASYAGYRMWAKPLAGVMCKVPSVRRLARFLVRSYTEEVAARLKMPGGRWNWAGLLMVELMPRFSAGLYHAARVLRLASPQLERINPGV